MRPWHKVVSAIVLASTFVGGSVGGVAAQEESAPHAVFVQSNDPSANTILAYRRASNGTLSLETTYDTGGKGGRVRGAQVDPLASQGSLIYDPQHHLLVGVNAGSNTIYAFDVDDGRLHRRDVVDSGGSFPVSVSIHDDLLYVLNAGGSGSVQGFRITDRHLHPIQASHRSLGLVPVTDDTAFLNTPGQVGFTPDGEHLIVTTKANGSHIDVFQVRRSGGLSDAPVENASSTPVPFAFTFDARNRLVVGEAGTSSVSTYTVRDNGKLTPIGSQTDSQSALCWIDRVDGTYFVANAGSGSVSAFRVDAAGTPRLIGTTDVGAGPIDLADAGGGRFLYVLLGGSGSVGGFSIHPDGSLSPIGSVQGGANQEGIVAL